MNWQKLLASEAIVYGVKETINNVRIALLSMLIFISEILISIVVVGLPAFLISMWQMPELKVLVVNTQTALSSGALATQEIFKEVTFGQMPRSVIIIGVLSCIFLVVLWSMFGAGYLRMIIKFHDSGTANLKEMFMGWHRGPRLLCASILFSLFIILGFCLFVIPGIYILVHGILYPFFMIDKNLGYIEALKRSFAAVKGNAWQIGSILLVLSLLSVSPTISFFAGFTKLLILVHAYRRLTA